jgi:hypothetical protein
MSFSSVQSQQYGNVSVYNLSGNGISTLGEVLLSIRSEGKYMYSIVIDLETTGTTFTNSTVKVGTNIYTQNEKISNVLKYDVLGEVYYNLNLAGVEEDGFDIYLYATTATVNKPVSWTGSLQLIKVV